MSPACPFIIYLSSVLTVLVTWYGNVSGMNGQSVGIAIYDFTEKHDSRTVGYQFLRFSNRANPQSRPQGRPTSSIMYPNDKKRNNRPTKCSDFLNSPLCVDDDLGDTAADIAAFSFR